MLRGRLATPLITTRPPQQAGAVGHQYGSHAAYPAGMAPAGVLGVLPEVGPLVLGLVRWAGGPKAYQPVTPARIASTTNAPTSSRRFRRPAGRSGPVPWPPVYGSWTAVRPAAPVAGDAG